MVQVGLALSSTILIITGIVNLSDFMATAGRD